MSQVELLVTRLEAADRAYRDGTPVMSDEEFTALEDQLRILSPEHEFLHRIADDVDEFNVEESLTIPMGSQKKALTLEEMSPFYDTTGADELHWSDKVDGCSAEVTYVDGKLAKVLTRGDGFVGVNITAIASNIPSLPQRIPTQAAKVVVRGEICMPRDNLARLNEELAAVNREPVANTRNGTVGIIKTLKNLPYAKWLDFRAFDIVIP